MIISWQSHIGKYLHCCDECGEEFNGRKNQQYCNLKCKAKHNNDLAISRRDREKEMTAGYLRNVELVLNELNGLTNEVVTVSMERLLALGFDPKVPNKRVKIEGELWYQIGPVSFRPLSESNEVELIKLE
jgi:hypothetical protein